VLAELTRWRQYRGNLVVIEVPLNDFVNQSIQEIKNLLVPKAHPARVKQLINQARPQLNKIKAEELPQYKQRGYTKVQINIDYALVSGGSSINIYIGQWLDQKKSSDNQVSEELRKDIKKLADDFGINIDEFKLGGKTGSSLKERIDIGLKIVDVFVAISEYVSSLTIVGAGLGVGSSIAFFFIAAYEVLDAFNSGDRICYVQGTSYAIVALSKGKAIPSCPAEKHSTAWDSGASSVKKSFVRTLSKRDRNAFQLFCYLLAIKRSNGEEALNSIYQSLSNTYLSGRERSFATGLKLTWPTPNKYSQ
jgi:hypothetical protein